ncbi:tetratricopeptide repeat protein [Rhodohalobacter halophilus]|uniref:tetratricopeptide repeat protein n=1 Tax=Rhodohalobacter halophilus TaxID=1812810 RepID=UPI00083FA5E8|nr:tetratricopeptide repeat protein [Rhodohalobacter halophilus]
MKKLIVLSLAVLIPLAVNAQTSDFERGISSYQNGQYDLAINYFEAAKRNNPAHMESYLLLAISYLEEEFPILAETTALEAYERFDSEGGFLWVAGEALLMQNQPESASEYFRQLFRYYEDYKFSDALNITELKIRDRWIDTELYKSSLAYQNRDFQRAVESLDTVLRLRPDHTDALKNRIYIYMEQEEWERALALVEEAEERVADDPDLIRMKANIYYRLENLDGLLQEYRQLYNQNPNNKETAFTYADILIANQRGSEAELVIAELIEQFSQDRDVYWKLVNVQEQRMYIQEKAGALKWLLENFPGDREALDELASTYKILEEYSDEREVLNELLNVTDDQLSVHIAITESYLAEGNISSAENQLQNIRSDYPGNEKLLELLGDILQMQNKWDESIIAFEEIESEQMLRIAGTRIGHAYYQLGEKKNAKELLSEVIDSGIDESLAWLLMADLELDENLEQAHEYALRALERGILEIAEIRQGTMEQLNNEGIYADIDEREEEYEHYEDTVQRSFQFLNQHYPQESVEQNLLEMVEAYENSATLHFFLAEMFYESGSLSLAEKHISRAISIFTQYYEAHILFGKIQRMKGDFRSASLSFERARSIRPEKAIAYRELVDLYNKEGSLQELINRWEIQYRGERSNETFKEFLIEVFHRTDQFEKARALLSD